MSDSTAQQLLDDLAAVVLAADPENLGSLAAFPENIAHVIDGLGDGPLRSTLKQIKKRVSMLLRGTSKSPQADLDGIARALSELQEHPENLGHRDGPSRKLEVNRQSDADILADFLSQQKLFLSDLEELALGLSRGAEDALAEIRRRIHTLKGEAGMLELSDLSQACHGIESLLDEPTTNADKAERLLLARDWIETALSAYASNAAPSESGAELVARLSTVQNQAVAPEPSPRPSEPLAPEPPSTQQDDAPCEWDESVVELVGEFLQEGDEGLTSVDQTLLAIEQSGSDPEQVNRLFRVFHTIKGVSSFLEIPQVTELAHATENMLQKVRDDGLTLQGNTLDLVFESTASLRLLLNDLREAVATHRVLRHVPEVDGLLVRLRSGSPSLRAKAPASKADAPVIVNAQSTAALASPPLPALAPSRPADDAPSTAAAVAPSPVAPVANQPRNAGPARIREVVKVDLERMDGLVETIGELVIVESMVANAPEVASLPSQLRNYLSQFAKITRELQEIGMRMRMVPVRGEFQKMTRMVRDLARRAGKQVHVEIRGEGTEIDRSMVEQIADPLVHLIRNAVDHGLEPPDERAQRGKPVVGTITLSAAHEGGSIVIEVADDGRGIDREAVLQKAIAKGLVRSGASLSDSEVYDLIFAAGFSTAKQVTEVSGRGVGMDVVKRNIERIRGRIITFSAPGRGTTFRLMLPLTLAIIDGMVVRCGDESFILPTQSILDSLQPSSQMLSSLAGENELILVRGQALPLFRMDRLLGVSGAEQDATRALVVILESLSGRIGLLVDEVLTQQQVVIKSMGHGLVADNMFSGAAILASGRVGLILNPEELVNAARSVRLSNTGTAGTQDTLSLSESANDSQATATSA